MTDHTFNQEDIEAAYRDGVFMADCFVQSLHDHGAAMGEKEAALAFHETMGDLTGEFPGTAYDAMTLSRLDGFLSRIGAQLWQLVCQEGEP